MRTIDRASYLPLYIQIRQHLRALIDELVLEEKTEFPSDDELARLFGVSRMTVRQAVSELVDEGFLVRVRGSGTYIASNKMIERISPVGDFFEGWANQGKAVSAEILAFEELPCPAHESALLKVPVGESVVYLKRKRTANSVPIAIDHRYFPLHIGHLLSPERLARESIHIILLPQLALSSAIANIEVEAVAASSAEALELDIPAASPLLVRRVAISTSKTQVLWSGKSVFRGDAYKYALQIPVEFQLPRAGASGQ